jgi:hypothetical protein
MRPLAVGGYTSSEVRAALHRGARSWRFRYERLDLNGRPIGELTNVLSATISNDATAKVKRTARFDIVDDGTVDFLSDRIKAYAGLVMPDGGVAEWPVGVFLLTTPPRASDESGVVTRKVDAYDLLQVLSDDRVIARYTVLAGARYMDAVGDLINTAGLFDVAITPSDAVLPTARDWDMGTPRLDIINDLLAAICYRSLFVDEEGVICARPYVTASARDPDYTYEADEESVLFPAITDKLDLFEIPNQWLIVRSEADSAPLTASWTNSNPDSPTSTVRRGRMIVHFESGVDAADQAALDGIVQRMAEEASQVYEEIDFGTGLMPFHGEYDVLELVYSPLGLYGKYLETQWSMEMAAGKQMTHTVQRMVEV